MKTTTVGIRLNEEERLTIRAKAQKAGLTVGALLKNMAINKPIKISQQADPVLLRELAAIGNNLNQVTRRIHEANKRKDISNKTALLFLSSLVDIEQDLQELL